MSTLATSQDIKTRKDHPPTLCKLISEEKKRKTKHLFPTAHKCSREAKQHLQDLKWFAANSWEKTRCPKVTSVQTETKEILNSRGKGKQRNVSLSEKLPFIYWLNWRRNDLNQIDNFRGEHFWGSRVGSTLMLQLQETMYTNYKCSNNSFWQFANLLNEKLSRSCRIVFWKNISWKAKNKNSINVQSGAKCFSLGNFKMQNVFELGSNWR